MRRKSQLSAVRHVQEVSVRPLADGNGRVIRPCRAVGIGKHSPLAGDNQRVAVSGFADRDGVLETCIGIVRKHFGALRYHQSIG